MYVVRERGQSQVVSAALRFSKGYGVAISRPRTRQTRTDRLWPVRGVGEASPWRTTHVALLVTTFSVG